MRISKGELKIYLVGKTVALSLQHSLGECLPLNVLLFSNFEEFFTDFFGSIEFSKTARAVVENHAICANDRLQLQRPVEILLIILSPQRVTQGAKETNCGVGMVLLEAEIKYVNLY